MAMSLPEMPEGEPGYLVRRSLAATAAARGAARCGARPEALGCGGSVGASNSAHSTPQRATTPRCPCGAGTSTSARRATSRSPPTARRACRSRTSRGRRVCRTCRTRSCRRLSGRRRRGVAAAARRWHRGASTDGACARRSRSTRVRWFSRCAAARPLERRRDPPAPTPRARPPRCRCGHAITDAEHAALDDRSYVLSFEPYIKAKQPLRALGADDDGRPPVMHLGKPPPLRASDGAPPAPLLRAPLLPAPECLRTCGRPRRPARVRVARPCRRVFGRGAQLRAVRVARARPDGRRAAAPLLPRRAPRHRAAR